MSSRRIFLSTLLITLFISGFLSSNCIAGTSKSEHFSFDNWVERIKKQAQNQGISDSTLENVFSQVKQIQTQNNRSNKISTDKFLNYSLANKRINNNKRLVSHYSDVLFEIKHLFGVDPEIIIALRDIDSLYGRAEKPFPIIDVLTSLSYRQPGNKKIKKELFEALKIIDEGQASSHQLISDANGNLVATPFKPTTFRNYAVDYDGDGKYDIWQNHADIFASTANYLNSIGWKSGEPWGMEIKLPLEFDAKLVGLNQQRSIDQWQKLGIRMPDGSDLPFVSSGMGSVIQPSTRSGKSFLVFDNYFALLRWKRSQQFAFAVGMMMDKIKQPAEALPMAPFADVSQQ